MDRCPTCGGQLTTGGCVRCPTYTVTGTGAPAIITPPLPTIDVPSMMYGNGYERGRADERAALIRWMRTPPPRGVAGGFGSASGVADAIEHGDHLSSFVASEQACDDHAGTAKVKP